MNNQRAFPRSARAAAAGGSVFALLNAGPVERERTVSAAKEAIQRHGGIAMTWECALSHYAEPLAMIDHPLDDVDHQTGRFAALTDASDADAA